MSKFEMAVRLYKTYLLTEALIRFEGNQCKAAESLGVHRNTLSRMIQLYHIQLGERGAGNIRRPPERVMAVGA